MPHKFDPHELARLCNPERRRRQPAEGALKALKLTKGEVFVDLGCGPGYFLVPAARRVTAAWGFDISPEMLRAAGQAARAARLANVHLRRMGESAIPMPAGKADAVLMANVLHELASPAKLLREIHRVLRPGGRLLVVDWKRERAPFGPPLHERIGRERARKLLLSAGFGKVTVLQVYKYHYALLADKAL